MTLGRWILLAYLTAVLTIALHFHILPSLFFSNLGWLQLARAYSSPEKDEPWSAKAQELFRRAVATQHANYEALLGAGISCILTGNELAASSSWRNAEIPPQVLLDLGHQAQADKTWNLALLYYKAAGRLDQEESHEGKFLAGNICQYAIAQPLVLSQRNRAYCRDRFTQAGGNLIVNSQFNGGNTWGWGKRYFSSPASANYGIDNSSGNPNPAAVVIGLTEDYHGGLFQSISLPPGITVQYSAKIRTESHEGTNVRLLYFGGQIDGKSFGNALQTITKDIGWTRFERTFQVPDVDGKLLTFFPALLTGTGTVWIDDVRVETIYPNTDSN